MRRTRDAAPLAADEGAKQGQPGGVQPKRGPDGESCGGILLDETIRSDQHPERAVETRPHYLMTPNAEFSGTAPLYGAASSGTQGYALEDEK